MLILPSLLCVLSRSVISNSLQSHGLLHTRHHCPWGFPRPEYWSQLPCPPPGDLPNLRVELRSPALQVDSLPSEPPGKSLFPSAWCSIGLYLNWCIFHPQTRTKRKMLLVIHVTEKGLITRIFTELLYVNKTKTNNWIEMWARDFFFLLHHAACEILVPRPGSELQQ